MKVITVKRLLSLLTPVFITATASAAQIAPKVSTPHVSVHTQTPTFKGVANGTHFKTGIITLRKAGGSQPYLKYELKDTQITSHSFSSGGSDPPSEK